MKLTTLINKVVPKCNNNTICSFDKSYQVLSSDAYQLKYYVKKSSLWNPNNRNPHQ